MVINKSTEGNEIGINVKNFNKGYEGRKIFDNLDLEVKKGEFVCIIGPNGCGKSTLIKSIAGLNDHEGNIQVDGSISLVGQNTEEMLLPWLNVKQNIIFPMKESEVDKKLLGNLLSLANLSNYAGNYPYQLSGGMNQMVLIARSLLNNAEIILLDEPFKSLDFFMAKKMQQKVLEICKVYKPTVLMVSHDIEEAIMMADKIVILSNKPTQIKKIIEINLGKRDVKMITSEKFNNIRKEIIDELLNE